MSPTQEAMRRNIMRQLINPNISIDNCKRVLQTLSAKTEDQLQTLLTQLNRNQAAYMEQVQKTSDDDFVQVCEQMKERIVQCCEWFDIQLKDVLVFTRGSRFQLLDVAWPLVTPNSLADIVNDYVRGQQEYVSAMSLLLYNVALSNKSDDLALPKSNLLVYGPTGVGKTYCPQVISRFLGIEIEIVNCNMLVQEGIIGVNLLDALTRAYMRNPNFTHLVIVLDEYDKLFFEKGYFNERILFETQTLSDDNSMVTFRDSFAPYASQRQMSTKYITVVYTGVFAGLKEIVERRLNIHRVGFSGQAKASDEKDEFYKHVSREDFVTYMKSGELAGRIGQAVHARPMSDEMLFDILQNAAESPMVPFQNFFSLHGTHLTLTDEAAQAIVTHVQDLQLGVRGLKTVLWKVLQEPMHGVGRRIPAQQITDELCIDRPQVEQIIAR